MTSGGISGHRRAIARVALFLVGGVTLMGSWIVASPHGSEPDGSYHLVSMICADGYDDTSCFDTGQGDGTAFVPFALWNAPCMSGDLYALGSCSEDGFTEGGNQFVSAGGNLFLSRPNLYYSAMRLLLVDDLNQWVFLVRSANAALFLLMILASVVIATGSVRQAVIGSWLLIAVPLVLFIMASVNTTAWGLIGTGAYWVGLATTIHAEARWRRIAGLILVLAGAVMALGSRTEAVANIIVATAGIAIWSIPRLRERLGSLRARQRTTVGLVAAGAAIGAMLVVAVTTPAVEVLGDARRNFGAGVDRLAERELGSIPIWLLAESWQFITGAFGDGWGLGWLDTPMPSVVSVGTLSALAGVAFLGVAEVRRWRAAAIAFTSVMMLTYPWLTLVSFGFFIGESFQPRHFLSILHVLIAIVLLRDRPSELLAIARPHRWLIWSALTLAHTFALHVAIRRYTVGLTMDWHLDLTADAAWWWSWAPIGPTAVWAAGSLAFGAVAALAVVELSRGAAAVQPTSGAAPARPTE